MIEKEIRAGAQKGVFMNYQRFFNHVNGRLFVDHFKYVYLDDYSIPYTIVMEFFRVRKAASVPSASLGELGIEIGALVTAHLGPEWPNRAMTRVFYTPSTGVIALTKSKF